jgi:hypothetical protein
VKLTHIPKQAQPVAVHANTNAISELKAVNGRIGDLAHYASITKNATAKRIPRIRQT